MQLDVLEARTQSAMLANKLVRLDNPILRARLSQVAKQHAAATRMRLPVAKQHAAATYVKLPGA
eukprot:1161163-Pelagomonas_calceolata.AAC.10